MTINKPKQLPHSPTVITATELKHKSGEIMRRVAQDGEHFIVERAGYPVVVILAIPDYEALLSGKSIPNTNSD